MPPWTDGGVDRGGPGHSGVLTGTRPPAAPVCQSGQSSPVGRNRERSARGARLGPHRARAASTRTGDGGEGSTVSVLGERAAQVWREGKRSGERCGETQ
jgi:hypothetical protein